MKAVVTLFLALAFLLQGQAQVWEVYDMATAGLPSNTVRAITHEANGTAWIGTDWGLLSYDGISWTTYQMANSPLPDNDIRALDVDEAGRLWIGTFGSGVVRKDGSNWTVFNTGNSDLPENQIKCVEADSLDVYICTIGGLAHFDGSDWRVYDDTPNSYNDLELPSGNISDVKIRDDGLIAIGTVNGGFTYLTDTSVTVYSTVGTGLPDNTALGVEIDQSGDRWAACPSGALLYHTGPHDVNQWLQYSTVSSTIPSNSLNDVVFDGLGRVCVSTQNAGVGIFEPPVTWINYTPANSDLPDVEVLTSALAPDGVLWFGTATGGAATLDLVTSVEDDTGDMWRMYPNPANRLLHVELEQGFTRNFLRLHDSSGRILLAREIGNGRTALEISELNSGVYFVELVSDGIRSVERLEVIQQ